KTMKESTFRRCQYVIQENMRVEAAMDALYQNDYVKFGELMYASHEGLSKEYNVSCEESDFLVEVARKNGVLGARMMGGGFGGCTINLLKEEDYDTFIADAIESYKQKFRKAPKIYDVKIGVGSHKIK
ncbi:MAG: galactokinase, partial [Bacteroidales bacterium]|nr:galactokinase [Bacteroidales bacterium]